MAAAESRADRTIALFRRRLWLQMAGSGTTLRIALVIKLEAIEHCTVSAPHDLKSPSACQRSDVKCPEAYGKRATLSNDRFGDVRLLRHYI